MNSGHDFKSQVLAATDIVELISQSVALKRRGKDYVGLCPFHQEKTPSFHVSPTRQFFHCYGCKAGGNAIDFVMLRDRLEFVDALRLLGERAGLEMPRRGASGDTGGQRKLLLDAHSAATAFFENQLAHGPQGKIAREYLLSRHFTDESVKRFQLGVAPDSWDALLSGSVGRKYKPELLATAGLVKPRQNGSGYYDTFRNRLMFPIRDEGGRVIAFGGRVLPGSNDPAKYLNSPETPLFSKSRCIFGLDLARQRIVETRTAVVVEGYTDVIMAHQHGVSNVVSVLGTALTDQHVKILQRFADRIILLFDADTAGDSAADKAVDLYLTQPIEIGIATMPPGVDPDEFLIQEGAAGFQKILDAAVDALTYKWHQLQRRLDANDLTSRQKAVEAYFDVLTTASTAGPIDPLRWGAALARVSRLIEVPLEQLHRRFSPKTQRPRRQANFPVQREVAQAAGSAQPKATTPSDRTTWTAQDRAERWLLGCLLAEPHWWHDVQLHVRVEEFEDPLRRALADRYWQYQRDEGEPVFSEWLSTLESPELKQLAVELVDEPRPGDTAEVLREVLAYFAEARQRREETKLVPRLRRTNEQRVAAPAQQPSVVAADQDDELALLLQLQAKAKRPDLRRVVS